MTAAPVDTCSDPELTAYCKANVDSFDTDAIYAPKDVAACIEDVRKAEALWQETADAYARLSDAHSTACVALIGAKEAEDHARRALARHDEQLRLRRERLDAARIDLALAVMRERGTVPAPERCDDPDCFDRTCPGSRPDDEECDPFTENALAGGGSPAARRLLGLPPVCPSCSHPATAHLPVTGCRHVLTPATETVSAVLCPCKGPAS